MSTAEQEQEQQTVAGVIASVITKGPDTWQIAVRDQANSQYTKNLWTKDGELVGRMTAMIGQEATFFCNVSHWTRQDGQPVRSLWINGWTTGGSGNGGGMQTLADPVAQAQAALDAARAAQAAQQQAAQQAAQQQQPQQQQAQPVSYDVKELRIMREAADKCAAWVLAAMIHAGGLTQNDLNPQMLHGFMDSFAKKRIRFYETGDSFNEDDIPF